MSEWISVKEKLPKHGQMVLVHDTTAVFDTQKIRHMVYCGYSEVHLPFVENISHWKPAIQPPTK